MATKKRTPKAHHTGGLRKNTGNEAATPAERLKATVFVISDGAKTKPPNCLIGDTPSETIGACKTIIDWLAHIEQPFTDGELNLAEAFVLRTVVHALNHAENEAKALWAAAEGMAGSIPEMANG